MLSFESYRKARCELLKVFAYVFRIITFVTECDIKMAHHKTVNNKKVLLRERKRHTDRRVASTRYATPGGGGGYPERAPHLDLDGGVPQGRPPT